MSATFASTTASRCTSFCSNVLLTFLLGLLKRCPAFSLLGLALLFRRYALLFRGDAVLLVGCALIFRHWHGGFVASARTLSLCRALGTHACSAVMRFCSRVALGFFGNALCSALMRLFSSLRWFQRHTCCLLLLAQFLCCHARGFIP